jgi:hypothetical protein
MTARKKKSQGRSSARRVANKASDQPKRRGLPDKASIVSTGSFVSPAGRRFKILRTNEKDEYDQETED